MRRVSVSARGRVQGVFFRASLERKASQHAITGWVRNTDDGRVEAQLQGSPADVEALVEFCRSGPGHAQVESLDVDELAVVEGEQGFDVR